MRHQNIIGSFAVASMWVAACDTGRMPVDSGELHVPAIGRTSRAPAAPQLRSYDAELEELVEQISGFGGMFVEDGRLHVYMKGNRPIPGSEREVLQKFITERTVLGSGPFRGVDDLTVIPAEYDYRELRRLYLLAGDLTSTLPITITDIDERNNRILIGVMDATAKEGAAAILRRAGIPQEAVNIEVVPPTVIQAGLQDYVRPTLAGTRIFAPKGCSLSFNAFQQLGDWMTGLSTDYSQAYFVTNSHCTSTYVGYDGATAGQPSLSAPIGFEIVDPVPFTNVQEPECPVGRACRWADAALFQYSTGVTASYPNIPSVSGLSIVGTRPIQESGVPWFMWDYHPVRKIGSTSGQSTGAIMNTCVRIPAYDGSVYSGVDFLCQYQATYSSTGGDSGAPVLNQESDSHVRLYGIHWGRQYFPGSTAIYATFSSFVPLQMEIHAASGLLVIPCDGCLW